MLVLAVAFARQLQQQPTVPTGLDWSQLGPLGGLVGLLFGVLLWAWQRDVKRADRLEERLWEQSRDMQDLVRATARVETAETAAAVVRGRGGGR